MGMSPVKANFSIRLVSAYANSGQMTCFDLDAVAAQSEWRICETCGGTLSANLFGVDVKCARSIRSRIAPMRQFARTMRNHRELVLTHFRARKRFSSGVVGRQNEKNGGPFR